MSTPPRDLMTEEIPRGAPDTVLQLRHSITDQQRGLLDSIWDAWASTRRPIPRRVLEQRPLGRTRVIELLESLGGSVVFRVGPSGNDPSGYCVTLLGALLTSGGNTLEALLGKLLHYLRHRIRAEPTLRELTSTDLLARGDFSESEVALLGRALGAPEGGLNWGGGYSDAQWSATIPESIDESLEAQDLQAEVRRLAAMRYDPSRPVDPDGRLQHAARSSAATRSKPDRTFMAQGKGNHASPQLAVAPVDHSQSGTRTRLVENVTMPTVLINGKELKVTTGHRSWEALRHIGGGGQGSVYAAREVAAVQEGELEFVRAFRDFDAINQYSEQDKTGRLVRALRGVITRSRDSEVALKIYVPRAHQSSSNVRGRFTREIETIRSATHQHVISLTDWGELEDGQMFVVMPYFRNGTLEGHRARFQGNSLEALRAILQVLEALCYLHDKGVAHRDLKPSNILIDDQGSLVVSDFGLAYDEHAIESVTQPGERVGNWQFCPDWEYLEQDYARNKLVDCYACAKVLWWMLSGGSVLRREDWNLPRFNLAGLFPGDPGMTAVNRILEKALASTPSDMKYNSARAMRDDVGAEIDSLVTRRVVPGSAPRQCRACQSGVYARAQGIHLSDFENWKTDMNRAAAPADKIVGVDVYRCRDCGHIAVYATHDRTGSA